MKRLISRIWLEIRYVGVFVREVFHPNFHSDIRVDRRSRTITVRRWHAPLK